MTLTMGDATKVRDQMRISLEGGVVDTVTTAAGAYAVNTYQVTVSDGQLTVLFEDLGGTTVRAVANGLEITSAVGGETLTVVIADASISENGGSTTATVTRSGDTTGDLVVTLASNDETEATVPATVTILGGDASADFAVTGEDDLDSDGTQTVTVTASASGYTSGDDTVDVLDDEPPPAVDEKYDFGTSSSPVSAGYTGVTNTAVYNAVDGYGWTVAPLGSFDREIGTDVERDANVGETMTFAADVANGTYDVTLTMGDATKVRDQMRISLEGVVVDTVTTAAGAYAVNTYQATVSDGQLTVLFEDLGGTTARVAINGLEVASI